MKNAVKKARKYREDIKTGFVPDLGFVDSKDYLELLEFVEAYGALKERTIKALEGRDTCTRISKI